MLLSSIQIVQNSASRLPVEDNIVQLSIDLGGKKQKILQNTLKSKQNNQQEQHI